MHTDRSQHAPSRSRWLLAAALLAAVLAPASAWAHTATKPAPQKPAPTRAKTHPTAGATAIAVHGLWTITVRNPSGTLASRHTFENSFDPNSTLLAAVLTGNSIVGLWGIELLGNNCSGTANSHGGCYVLEAADPETLTANVGRVYFPTLTVADTGLDVVLSGSATMTSPEASGITGVNTLLNSCTPGEGGPGGTPCGSQTALETGPFTQCALATSPQSAPACIRADGSPITAAIPVKPNQQVAVKVVISFT